MQLSAGKLHFSYAGDVSHVAQRRRTAIGGVVYWRGCEGVHRLPPARAANFVRTLISRSESRTLSVLRDSVPKEGTAGKGEL